MAFVATPFWPLHLLLDSVIVLSLVSAITVSVRLSHSHLEEPGAWKAVLRGGAAALFFWLLISAPLGTLRPFLLARVGWTTATVFLPVGILLWLGRKSGLSL